MDLNPFDYENKAFVHKSGQNFGDVSAGYILAADISG